MMYALWGTAFKVLVKVICRYHKMEISPGCMGKQDKNDYSCQGAPNAMHPNFHFLDIYPVSTEPNNTRQVKF
jgi:hypothetical protein